MNYHIGSKPRLIEPIRYFGHPPKRLGLCLQNIYNGSFTVTLLQMTPKLSIQYFVLSPLKEMASRNFPLLFIAAMPFLNTHTHIHIHLYVAPKGIV